jgi:DNA-binding NarL/FixJ family response regulator
MVDGLRVLLVDDHPLFRSGLAVALRGVRELEVVGEAGSASEMRALARRIEVDVAVVDLLMPTVSGISITQELVELRPSCRILGLSVVDEPGLIADMLRAGAAGYALKTQSVEAIVDAIRQIAGGVRYLPPGVSRNMIDGELASPTATPLGRLTRREREIFELIIRGYSNSEIASQLFIAPRTVETHRLRITKKLSARSIVELQRIAARFGGLAT